MRTIYVSMLAMCIIAVVIMGCSTCPPGTDLMQAECVIETHESNVIAEVMLDGKFIFSSKTWHGEYGNVQTCTFAAQPGDHHLSVMAAGHEPWQRKITIGASNKFWAKLNAK